jgi:hypothetical protein
MAQPVDASDGRRLESTDDNEGLMKKLMIVIGIALLLIATPAMAAKFTMADNVTVETKVVCESGKKFLITVARNKNSLDVETKVNQIYTKFNNWSNPPIPEECK